MNEFRAGRFEARIYHHSSQSDMNKSGIDRKVQGARKKFNGNRGGEL